MKKIRDKIECHILSADRKWKALPTKRQRLFIKLFFAGYAVLTLLVFASIWISTGSKTNTIPISPIRTISDHTAVKKQAQENKENSTIKK